MKSRIIICGLGETGLAVARSALKNPGLQIIGVVDSDQERQGQDIGNLLGLEPVGLTINHDESAICDVESDCVIVTPSASASHSDYKAQILRLLESGRNVISTITWFDSEQDRESIQQACQTGGARFHTTGLFPQLLLERFALTLGKALQKTDHIRLVQAIDCQQMPADLQREVQAIGLGGAAENSERLLEGQQHTIAAQVDLVARELFGNTDGIRIERVIDVMSARKKIAGTVIPIAKGCAAAISLTHQAWRGKVCFFTCEQYWYVGQDYQPSTHILPYERRNTPFNFSVRVEGEPGLLESQLEFGPVEVGSNPLSHVAAQGVLAAIPSMVSAQPGILVNDASPHYQLDDRLPMAEIHSVQKNHPPANRAIVW